MNDNYPLLFFPTAQNLIPPKGRAQSIGQPNVPSKTVQSGRLAPQLQLVEDTFTKIVKAASESTLGLESETILVMEIAGTISDFKQALEAVGLEWLNEWGEDGFSPDENFFNLNAKGQLTQNLVKNRLFISLANQAAMQQLLSLWQRWQKDEGFIHGTNKWKQLFDQLVTIRPWGVEEILEETGMLDRWQELLDPIVPDQIISFQIDLFYRRQESQRKKIEQQLAIVLAKLGGQLTKTLDIEEIRFHALKAKLPAAAIKSLLDQLNSSRLDKKISLFNFPGIMYFRPTGQSITSFTVEESGDSNVAAQVATQPPVAALIDGLPLANHQALNGSLIIDDMFALEPHYQQGRRIHGTSMASLIMRGDLSAGEMPLTKQLYCIPVLQPDTKNLSSHNVVEHVPEDEFLEERILLAVRNLFESTDSTTLAQNIKLINLSIGNPEQIFTHTPSPLARLIDWLSFKYRVLFIVSAGNYTAPLELDIGYREWQQLTQEEKTKLALKATNNNELQRRLISPAEAFNVLTVGGMHQDEAGDYFKGNRIDLFKGLNLPSSISRLGHGFRRSVKPEIYFPADRQLFNEPFTNSQTDMSLNNSISSPGHRVAWASSAQGELQKIAFTRGTSNATALAGEKRWRKLIVTLAWFNPINPNHANLREAKLELISAKKKWEETPLGIQRIQSDYNQVKRGTVQHEIFESEREIAAYQDGEELLLHITCKPDATQNLDELIPYALAVTLEVKEDVQLPIYQQIRTKIQQQIRAATKIKIRA